MGSPPWISRSGAGVTPRRHYYQNCGTARPTATDKYSSCTGYAASARGDGEPVGGTSKTQQWQGHRPSSRLERDSVLVVAVFVLLLWDGIVGSALLVHVAQVLWMQPLLHANPANRNPPPAWRDLPSPTPAPSPRVSAGRRLGWHCLHTAPLPSPPPAPWDGLLASDYHDGAQPARLARPETGRRVSRVQGRNTRAGDGMTSQDQLCTGRARYITGWLGGMTRRPQDGSDHAASTRLQYASLGISLAPPSYKCPRPPPLRPSFGPSAYVPRQESSNVPSIADPSLLEGPTHVHAADGVWLAGTGVDLPLRGVGRRGQDRELPRRRHLNADASFLLTFQPLLPFPPPPTQSTQSFTILLDPWITGPSKIFHSKFSISTHRTPPCIASLSALPEPDLVIISQEKSDHCHEATLKQLPSHGGKTVILAEPAAAKTIRGWKYFDPSKVVTLPKWEDPRLRRSKTTHRIAVPALSPNGQLGEVTIAFLAQKLDLTGLHSAVGITYRPPSTTEEKFSALPMTPPDSPRSCQSTFSASVSDRALSVIYSPHGCNYKTLSPYVTSHLIAEAALPLTVLLHCFDRISNPWYLGGNICAGFPGGREIAENLCAKSWISAHDGDKETKGIGTLKLVSEKYEREVVEEIVSPRSEKFPNKRTGTEVVVLGVGGELRLVPSMLDFEGSEDGDVREMRSIETTR
ncbi:hypothetical protein B7494_g1151 [Chlorociboria aeruginascens]|nr:hypothetical protein B7494_g1151 [Chlorociboria aeruginascens]